MQNLRNAVYNGSLSMLNQRLFFFAASRDISRTSKYSALTSSTWTDEFRQRWRGLTSGLTNAICRSRAESRKSLQLAPETGLLVIVNVKTQPRKNAAEQPAAIFISYSVISFIQGNAGCARVRCPPDANTPRLLCRGANSRRNFDSFPYHIFFFVHRYTAEKLMIPFAVWNTK